MKLLDGLTNWVSGFGAGGDKNTANTYVTPLMHAAEIDAAFRTTWLGKIIRIKAEDTVRLWREWQAGKKQITAIEKEEKRLGLRLKLMEADMLAMKDGTAYLFMGGLPGNTAMPVNVNATGLGALKYLVVLPADRVTVGPRVTDAVAENFGQPEYYTLGTQRVHPSRIVRLTGNERMSDLAWDGRGDPVWLSLKGSVENSDVIAAAVAAMAHEAKVDVWGIPGLMGNLATAEYEALLTRRVMLAQTAKSTINAIMIDSGGPDGKGGETLETKQLSFAGLSDIQDRAMMLLAGAADIPQTRLFGRAPAGMNATGDSDARNYAAMIRARQELKIQPNIGLLDEVLIRSALGSRPEEIWYRWRDLYQVTEKEGAEIEKAYADGYLVRLNAGSIDEVVLSKAETNRMIESGRYPGLEDAISESAEEGGIIDPDEREAKEIERMQVEAEARPVPVAANDAEPRTLYVRRDVKNAKAIRDFYVAQGVDVMPAEKMHVTVIYSRTPVDWFAVGDAWEDEIKLPKGGARAHDLFGPPGAEDTLVLMIKSQSLEWRNAEFIRHGAVMSYPEYQPHISLSKYGEGAKVDITKLVPWIGPVVLGPEIFEEVREG